MMKKVIGVAAGIAVGCAVASLIVHRRPLMACIKGEPMPEPPEWHKHCVHKEKA